MFSVVLYIDWKSVNFLWISEILSDSNFESYKKNNPPPLKKINIKKA